MSNVLEDPQLDLNISSNISNDHVSLLDPALEYLDDSTYDGGLADYNDNGNYTHSNISNTSNTSNTTPEFSSPNDAHYANYHYNAAATAAPAMNHPDNYYDYTHLTGFKSHVKSQSFSLPDKLNLLSLQNISQDSSKSPSPEFIYHAKDDHDDRTINPKQLFTIKNVKPAAISTASVQGATAVVPGTGAGVSRKNKRKSMDHEETLTFDPPIADTGMHPDERREYVLPSSSSSPNLSTFFSQYTQRNLDMDFKMNNECFNAIKMWLNNNDLGSNGNNEIVINPTGIIKNTSTLSKRRNSIQSVNASPAPVTPAIEKRKRRKSTNSNATLTEFKASLFSMDVHELDHDLEVSLSPTDRNSRESTSKSSSQQPGSAGVGVGSGDDETGKPFPCPECNKQFKRSEHLKRHIRSVHSNIRPFHCKYCEKQFSRSDNLAQHLKTHYKLNANGTTSIIYGNPNLHNRGGRRKNSGSNGVSGMMGPGSPTQPSSTGTD
ncbi:zf-C2H2 Zinc finger, C2H2 type [Yamadazyma tenuis]|uniref:C2H2-type domain-containing protein n=1 Tax=Candida tenuis (strain ATCC 10573 / BCRC 21748 / CBS 615 / JCM 9827 / NBRC 10315 / NRRL Y-1498 / VKM Y-70) TaxID=590646 RepID=G3B3N4_CANTC|nr:uncharacterized protein CANTEDRAFT_134781 [Yamadazyma tenuis ATCC 10573]EGV64193.1 hypothetical protein CANTEDRAFT_134781 [Yamadazyma tenuis ATCC 10573]WEJ96144.1 zf-C2H2 Zinc finger, C2H2 type [Yamadazyma tenuis]